MSQENAEVVHAFVEAFNRGDVDSALSLLTEDVDFRPPSHLLDGDVFRGHSGFRAWVERTRESWRTAEGTAHEIAAVGECLVTAVEYRLVGHGSGAPVDTRAFSVWTVRGGKIASFIAYPDEHEALAAVGLTEGPPKNP
jgi:ketosteroid isomerase-like protein